MAVLLSAMAGCSVAPGPAKLQLGDDVARPERPVFIFFPDGMDRTRFDELLAAGRLPNIRKVFVEGGVGVEHSVTSLPSITYPNCSSMITGVFPGHHGIMGNFWFDRQTLECRDYRTLETCKTVDQHLKRPTLYDILADHLTVSVHHHTRKGATETLDLASAFATAWFLQDYTMADWHAGHQLPAIAQLANRVKRWPSVIMTYYPGVDEIGHRFGPGSEQYARALQNIDRIVGDTVDSLRLTGLAQSAYFVLVTDHGMAPVGEKTQMDFRRWLREARKLRVRTDALNAGMYFDRYAMMKPYDAVATVEDAGRVAMVHLRGRRGWPYRPAPGEVLAWITAEPAVHELPAVRAAVMRDGPDRVRLISRLGTAAIERRRDGQDKLYRLLPDQGDPLGYLGDPALAAFVAEGWHTSRHWLEATAHAPCPDFVPQVVEMLDSPRTGDVVVFAAEGWSLCTGERGGHGSCLARDMRNLLYIAGPDLPAGRSVRFARLVDLVPTLLGLLGESDRLNDLPPIDGISLAGQFR